MLDDCQCCGLLEEDCSICWEFGSLGPQAEKKKRKKKKKPPTHMMSRDRARTPMSRIALESK